MASKALKGLTIKIGGDTSELTKALDKVDKQSRNLSSELGQINKLLKLDPTNTELLVQKQKVLAEAISSTEERLDTLKEAEKQAQEQFLKGEVSEEQYRALQREIIATEKKLDGYKNAAEETDKAVADLGDETKKASKDVEDLGEEAEVAEAGVERLGGALKTGLAVGLGAVAAAAVGAIAGIKSVVEETAEYRREMGKLDTAFKTNGHSSEAATQTYRELQGVLGDTGQAVEAAAFIARLADTEEELVTWTNIATGVYGAFGASLPIEGLTEAANETAKVGQVTGPLADALNWAAKEGETFGVKLKAATEENAEWNEAVMAATSAEDFFNLALQECSTEQERQALIMSTLNSLYSDAADQYRTTNKEVIDQNKATEKLNAAWAKLGQKAAPIVTTFTEGLAELVETFMELIEDVDIEGFTKEIRSGFTKIAKDVLPKLIDALEWCIKNFDLIKSAAIGFITAMAAQKILTFANAVRTKLVPALKAGTKGFKAMDAAAKTNVYIALASAIIGVATAIGSYLNEQAEKMRREIYENTMAVHGLTEAEKEMVERTKESAAAFREQRLALDTNTKGINSQFDYVGALKDELFNLADAQGKVAQQDQSRAQFIIGQLESALGIEIEMVNGVIKGYKELKTSIEDALAAKRAEVLLAGYEDAYVTAVQNRQQAETDYYASVAALQDAKVQRDRINAEIEAANLEIASSTSIFERNAAIERRDQLYAERDAIRDTLSDAQEAYDNNRMMLEGYYADMGQFETAQRLLLEGNTEEAARVLSDRAYYMEQYAATVGYESDQIMNSWELEATTAGIQAAAIKENFENGVEGYTEDMVREAEETYQELLLAMDTAADIKETFEDGVEGYTDGMVTEAEDSYEAIVGAMGGAYDDGYQVGSDFSGGFTAGMESSKGMVTSKAFSIVTAAVNAAKLAADINSPSRKMMEVGTYMGEGAEIGLEKTTDQVSKAAANQAKSIIDAYDGILAQDGQRALRQLEGAEASGRYATQMTAATATNPMLEKILTAIEKGQVLTIDGNTLVGATAAKMDNALGSRRALSARGAI